MDCLEQIYLWQDQRVASRKENQEIDKQIKVMHKADKFRVQGIDRHLFTLSLKKNGRSSHWTGNNNGWSVLQLLMRHGWNKRIPDFHLSATHLKLE